MVYNAPSLASGDFDNDGIPDVAVATTGENAVSLGFVTIMFGNGDGTFSRTHRLMTGGFTYGAKVLPDPGGNTPDGFVAGRPLLPFTVVTADFNGDGGADLATGDGQWTAQVGRATVILNSPVIALAPTTLAFGPQGVGTTSAPQVVTISNPGVTPLGVSKVSATGDFSPSSNCPTKLLPGKSCAVSVSFTPTVPGERSGTLTIQDTAGTSPQRIALLGTGT